MFAVRYTNGYEGESRLRFPTVTPPVQMESENNDSVGNANGLVLANSTVGHLQATIAGYVGLSDGGDYYRLGNLTAGTTISLGESQPGTSSLSAVLAILNSSGTAVATSAAGAISFTYTIPTGGDGFYYTRLTP